MEAMCIKEKQTGLMKNERIYNIFRKIVNKRISLKQGDKVIVRWGEYPHHQRVKGEVEEFYIYGIKLTQIKPVFPTNSGRDYLYGIKLTQTNAVFPFNSGRFYGCGYDSSGQSAFTLKKDWHYYPAKFCEWLRLKLPYKLGVYFFGF